MLLQNLKLTMVLLSRLAFMVDCQFHKHFQRLTFCGIMLNFPPFCIGCSPGFLLPSGKCCKSGILSASGTCCAVGAVLDTQGECCEGKLDACGVCNGAAVAIDKTGVCCTANIDPNTGRCCDIGRFGWLPLCVQLGQSMCYSCVDVNNS